MSKKPFKTLGLSRARRHGIAYGHLTPMDADLLSNFHLLPTCPPKKDFLTALKCPWCLLYIIPGIPDWNELTHLPIPWSTRETYGDSQLLRNLERR